MVCEDFWIGTGNWEFCRQQRREVHHIFYWKGKDDERQLVKVSLGHTSSNSVKVTWTVCATFREHLVKQIELDTHTPLTYMYALILCQNKYINCHRGVWFKPTFNRQCPQLLAFQLSGSSQFFWVKYITVCWYFRFTQRYSNPNMGFLPWWK